jgi:2-methylcitrate dehydratase PrpD
VVKDSPGEQLQGALAEWASGASFASLPHAVVEATVRSVVDLVGVAVAGTRTDLAGVLRAGSRGGRPGAGATVVCGGSGWDPERAALVNGALGHVLDFDDTSRALIGHPTTVVFPAVLGASELLLGERGRDVPGAELVVGCAVGVEVAARLGRVVNPAMFQAGWFTTAVLGAIGAAAGAARVLGLDPGRTASALGLAGGLAGGTRANNGTMGKAYLAGAAARSGLEAALAARCGLAAAPDVLSGGDGLAWAHARLALGPEALEALEDLGQRFEAQNPGLVLKRYPCCSAAAAPVDALLELLAEEGLSADAVVRVACRSTGLAARSLPFERPRSWREAQFSLPYCLAAAWTRGRLGLDAFSDAAVRDPGVEDAMGRVEVSFDLEDETGRSEAALVAVWTRDGRRVERLVPYAAGSPERPLGEDELRDKFLSCAGTRWGTEGAQAAFGVLRALPAHALTVLRDVLGDPGGAAAASRAAPGRGKDDR